MCTTLKPPMKSRISRSGTTYFWGVSSREDSLLSLLRSLLGIGVSVFSSNFARLMEVSALVPHSTDHSDSTRQRVRRVLHARPPKSHFYVTDYTRRAGTRGHTGSLEARPLITCDSSESGQPRRQGRTDTTHYLPEKSLTRD